jgi:hypothetical protein
MARHFCPHIEAQDIQNEPKNKKYRVSFDGVTGAACLPATSMARYFCPLVKA